MARNQRIATCQRKSRETRIALTLSLDGGDYTIDTGVGFFDHLLSHLAQHGRLGLKINARGDRHVDDHHTVEDVGIVLGTALTEALGDKKGIVRFGYAEVPLDEALVAVTVDLSGRPYFVYNVKIRQQRIGSGVEHGVGRRLADQSGLHRRVAPRHRAKAAEGE